MFTQTAALNDAIYAARGKDYAAEAHAIAAVIRAAQPDAATLLDVGCGTGAHLEAFARLGFEIVGVDADPKMVALARGRLADARIECADMTTFDLGTRFDAVVSLFGSTAYARTSQRLDATLVRIASHLRADGIAIVEPFLGPDVFRVGHLDAIFVDGEDHKIARMSLAKQVGKIAVLDFHYLVATARGVERLFERHELGLFDADAYRGAFTAAGLSFRAVEPGPFERGLYGGLAGS